MMKSARVLILLLFLFAPVLLMAQGMQRKVSFMVIDAQDNQPVWNYTATLMTADSAVVKTVVMQEDTTSYIRQWGVSIPFTGKGKFILRLTSVGYETLDTPFEIKSNRQAVVDLHMLKMNPDSKMLNEVVVTGTKIKMVLRGDTVVFNADAFKLAEGSMLDALIAQFPGAELNSNGDIKVNGRKIESLLVDGKDFFAGDPKAALKNLPAYTVNKVKVFDRDGKDTEMMGRDMGDRQYVMDVRLKKQYQKSLMGNIRVGAGTDNRFLANGMVRLSRGKSAIGVATQLNNVNDMELPIGGVVTSEMIQARNQPTTGVATNRSYGLSYSYGEFSDPFNINVSSTLSHNNSTNESWNSSQTYLAGGDTYGRSSSYSKGRNINWNNTVFFMASPKGLHAFGTLTYTHGKGQNAGNNLSASFDRDPMAYSDILHDVFDHPEKYRAMTLNMTKAASQSENISDNVNGYVNANVKIGSDMISTNIRGSYSRTDNESFSLNDLRYPKNNLRDFRHEYHPAPSHSSSLEASAGYNYGLGRHGITLNYRFGYQQSSNESMLYRLDRLADNDSTTLNMLPSTRDVLRSVIDDANSYHYDSHTYNNTLSLSFNWVPVENKKQITQGAFSPTSGDLSVNLSFPFNWQKRDMNYFRQKESRVDQSNLFVNPTLNINYRKSNNKGMTNAMLRASINTSAPDMLSLIDFRDDSNPLNVRLGNPDLKNSRMYQVSASWNNNWSKNMGLLNIDTHYSLTDRQMAYSMVYDKTSGVRTSRPVNVNGNWNVGGGVTVGRGSSMFTKKKNVFSFENRLTFNYSHSVDLATVAGQDESQRNTVDNSTLSDNLRMTVQLGSNSQVGLTASGTYRHTQGDREDFNTINAGEYSYGANAVIALPWKLQLSTDITNFCHRGYSASEMNTDELIWNASLTKTMMKGKLLVTLKATDLLGNLKNRQFNIDEQGRTETFYNVIPRYGMLTVSYRFNTMPKKRSNNSMLVF